MKNNTTEIAEYVYLRSMCDQHGKTRGGKIGEDESNSMQKGAEKHAKRENHS